MTNLFNIYLLNLLCLPSSVTGEVYCFPRRQLILSSRRCVIYHSKGLWQYIPKLIPSVCLSICATIFERIAGLCFNSKGLFPLTGVATHEMLWIGNHFSQCNYSTQRRTLYVDNPSEIGGRIYVKFTAFREWRRLWVDSESQWKQALNF